MIVTEYPQIKEDITAENPSGYVSFILFSYYESRLLFVGEYFKKIE